MAISVSSSPFEAVASAFSHAGTSLLAIFEEFGRARAAKALYSELSVMSDSELAAMGLKRCDISHTVYARVYDVR
ncbi:DUF1127 domain-containing protein [Roseibium litorale]|uniref:DUF1127 domain-containing protein n=1 Tax=Roseibium litorale TaxID=2803841 RepID=A0ABR9CL16_9HYPH|nr:DUF1127 domain-containing protein [Roseibium litorale]MBD8891545.1 DUF1127 domain-containing protein [Roseibium litorale]